MHLSILKKPSLALLIGCSFMFSLSSHAESINAYIGTYSPHGEGIYLTQVDSYTGAMSKPQQVATVTNGAQLIYHNDLHTLYVASEIEQGVILAYATNTDGSLTELNRVSSAGDGPVYLSLHPSGKYLLVANYISGSIAVFPIQKSGQLDQAVTVIQSEGEPGLGYPAAAAPGSFAISDHNGPHAHMIGSDPSGKFVFSTDLGLDRIYQWQFDVQTGQLKPNTPAFISASSEGAGPRHFVFHPNGKVVYLINEEASTLTVYDFNTTTGTLTERNSISSLPENYAGTSYASGIIISQDGRSLYIANRLHNSLSQFAIDDKGDVKLVDNIWIRGDYTRTIVFSPNQDYIYAMNQRSDHMVRFAVNKQTGQLTFVDNYTPLGSPSQMVFTR